MRDNHKIPLKNLTQNIGNQILFRQRQEPFFLQFLLKYVSFFFRIIPSLFDFLNHFFKVWFDIGIFHKHFKRRYSLNAFDRLPLFWGSNFISKAWYFFCKALLKNSLGCWSLLFYKPINLHIAISTWKGHVKEWFTVLITATL